MSQRTKTTFVENLILSGSTAAISKTAAAPIERVKLLIQSQDEIMKSGRLSKPYKGAADCVRKIYMSEGILPFWRGNVANCIRYFPTQALNFALKDHIKTRFKKRKNNTKINNLSKNMASGGIAGGFTMCILYSLDYARTRLANDNKLTGNGDQRQFKGLIDVYRKTLKSDGFIGVYRGFVISCLGMIVYRGMYFGLYDTLKPELLGDTPNFFLSFLLGYGVTVSAGVLVYPFDTVRRRMMMTSCQTEKYNGSIDCIARIIHKDGSMALMKGCGVNVLRGIVGACVLVGFDVFQTMYIRLRIKPSNSQIPIKDR